MRNILLALMLAAVMSADEVKYAIQVLNIQDKEAVTEAFEKKARAVPMRYTQKHKSGRYKVFLGEFETHEEAVANLTFVRERVSEDAFVVRMEDEFAFALDPQQQMQQAIVMAQAKSLQKIEKETETPLIAKEAEDAIPVAVPEPEKKIVIVKQEKQSAPAVKKEAKSEEIYCKPSKKALRESEISDAIAFYTNSSYYKFTE